MCDCKKQLEAQLTERFKAQAPTAREHRVRLQGFGVAIQGNTMVEKGYMPYQTFAYVPLKKGGEKPQKATGSMFFSFCPWCGEKVTQPSQQERAHNIPQPDQQ